MFEPGYFLLSYLQVYRTIILLCPVCGLIHLLVLKCHYCILCFYNLHLILFMDVSFPMKYFILSCIFLNMILTVILKFVPDNSNDWVIWQFCINFLSLDPLVYLQFFFFYWMTDILHENMRRLWRICTSSSELERITLI